MWGRAHGRRMLDYTVLRFPQAQIRHQSKTKNRLKDRIFEVSFENSSSVQTYVFGSVSLHLQTSFLSSSA